jgi:hypothetical protein
MLAPGFAFPVEPAPAPGDGVVEPGCVADGAGGELGVLPLDVLRQKRVRFTRRLTVLLR